MQTHWKRIPLQHAFNVRDLGGYPAADGKTVRWHTLLRGDSLTSLSPEDWALLYQYGVRTVIDLRSSAETAAHPDHCPDGVGYLHCPLQTEADAPSRTQCGDTDVHAFARSMLEGYCEIVRDEAPLVAAALSHTVRALQSGAVLFHCTAGKDRTGVLAALLYLLLGVAEEDIIADYQVSFTYNEKGINRLLAGNPVLKELQHLMYSRWEDMAALLSFIRETDALRRLQQAGYDPALTVRLRQLALE